MADKLAAVADGPVDLAQSLTTRPDTNVAAVDDWLLQAALMGLVESIKKATASLSTST